MLRGMLLGARSRRQIPLFVSALAALALLPWASSLLSAAPPDGPFEVFGQVTVAEGGPAGVRVELVPCVGTFERGDLALQGRAEPEAIAGALTSEDGSFRLLAPGTGMWKLLVSRPGAVPMELFLAPLTAEADVPAVELADDSGLRVRVLGEDGAPIEGAQVLVTAVERQDPFAPWSARWRPGRRLASTDAEGRARLPAAASESVRVEVRATGHLGRVIQEPAQRSLEVRLARGAEHAVQIRDSRRAAAGRALVWLDDHELPTAQASDAGGLRLALPRSRCRLRLVSPSKEHLATEATSRLPEPAAALLLQLEPPHHLIGRVIDGGERDPLPGALVWVGRDFGAAVTTDAQGRYELPLGWESEGGLRATAAGYLTEVVRPAGEGKAPLEGATLALQRRVQIAGLAVDTEGLPLAGVEIRARYDAGATKLAPLMTRTSGGMARTRPSGRFRIDQLVPGTTYQVRLAKEGYAPATLTVTAPEPRSPVPDLRVVLDAGAIVRGEVVDARRQGVRGARVDLVPGATASRSFGGRLQEMRDPDAELAHAAFTDEKGRFELTGVQGGRFDLMVAAPGFAVSRIPGLEVPAVRHPVELGTIELEPEATVVGQVLAEDGRPLEGARVTIEPADPLAALVASTAGDAGVPAGMSNREGWFALGGLRAGERIELRIERAGYGTAEIVGVAVPPSSPLRVVLERARRLFGKVVDIHQAPIPGARVRALLPRPEIVAGMVVRSGQLLETDSQADGTFVFEGLPSGRLELTATAPGFAIGKLEARLPLADGQGEVDLVLRPGSSLRGQVLAPGGEPVAGAEIGEDTPQVAGVIALRAPLATTDGDGGYLIEGLEPGLRPLAASHASFGRVAMELALEAGDNRADFLFPSGLVISGRVEDADGTGVGGAVVRLRPRTGYPMPLLASSRDDGSFTFAGLRAGRFELEAEKPETGRTEGPVLVEAREEEGASVTLQLARTASVRGRLSGLSVDELARVQLSVGSGAPGAGRVAGDGSYEVSGLSPGRWRVAAFLAGTGRQAEGEVELEASEDAATLDLDFREGLALSGVVRRNGVPLAGASVEAQREGGASSWGETDAAGEFRLEGLPAAHYHLQITDHRTELRETRALALEEDLSVAIDLAVGPVVGQAVDAETDRPLTEAVVLLTPAGSDLGQRRSSRQGVTSADGRFRLDDVAVGRWNLLVRKPGYVPTQTELRVVAGEPAEIGPLQLHPVEREARTGVGSITADKGER